MELNAGNTGHRAKELAPSQSPRPCPMVGSFPRAQGRQLERSWALVPVQLLVLLVAWISPTPGHSPSGSRNTFIQTIRGTQGQASKSGLLPSEGLSGIPEPPEKCVVASVLLASDGADRPSFRRAEVLPSRWKQPGQGNGKQEVVGGMAAESSWERNSRAEAAPEEGCP